MKLNDKLAVIQTKFKSKKSRFNSFGKYYFRSAEDILEAIKPYLLEHGITVTINEELINDCYELCPDGCDGDQGDSSCLCEDNCTTQALLNVANYCQL